jgi:hypothetical protein
MTRISTNGEFGPETGLPDGLSRLEKNLVKGVNEGDSAQVIVPMGNIKFKKCPLYP